MSWPHPCSTGCQHREVGKTVTPLLGALRKTESQAHGSGAVVGTHLSAEEEQVISAETTKSLLQQDLDNELKPTTLTTSLSCRMCLPPPRCPKDMRRSQVSSDGSALRTRALHGHGKEESDILGKRHREGQTSQNNVKL